MEGSLQLEALIESSERTGGMSTTLVTCTCGVMLESNAGHGLSLSHFNILALVRIAVLVSGPSHALKVDKEHLG